MTELLSDEAKTRLRYVLFSTLVKANAYNSDTGLTNQNYLQRLYVLDDVFTQMNMFEDFENLTNLVKNQYWHEAIDHQGNTIYMPVNQPYNDFSPVYAEDFKKIETDIPSDLQRYLKDGCLH